MLRHTAKILINSEKEYGEKRALYHYNWAEVIIHSCNEYYNLKLDKKALNMITPFGGGMYTENACGILTGGTAALGAIFTQDKPSENRKLKKVTMRWVREFQNEFQDLNCNVIKDVNLEEGEGCSSLILKACDILEEIIKDGFKRELFLA